MRRNRVVFLAVVVGIAAGQLLSLSLVYAAQDFSFFDVVWAKGLAIEDDEGNIAIQLTTLDDGSGAIHMPQGASLILTTPTSEQMMVVNVNELFSRIMMLSADKGFVRVGIDTDAGVSVEQGDGVFHHFPDPDAPTDRPGTAAKPVTWGEIKAMQEEMNSDFSR